MRAPTFRSSSRQERPLPKALPLVARPRRPASGERAAGAVFPLAGLAIAAAATIAVFFGVGLAGLLEHPPAVDRSPAASAVAPESPPPRPDASHRAALLPQPPATIASPAGRAAAPTPPASTPSPPQATPKTAAPSPAAPSPGAPPAVAPLAAPSPPAAAAAAKSAPAPAPAASGHTLSPAETAALLAAGDAAFRRGDLAAARVSYRRVYEAGEGRGALGMGASYDPLFLQHFHLTREHADPAEARTWYQRAKTLGAGEAGGRLDRLAGKPSP